MEYDPEKNSFNTIGFTEFKKSEKQFRKYKHRKVDDFQGLLDFNSITDAELESHQITKTYLKNINNPDESAPLLTCYNFSWPKGLMLIKNYLSPIRQIDITLNAMNNWINKPQRTNLFIYEDQNLKQNSTAPKNFKAIQAKIVDDENRFFFQRAIRWVNVGKQYDWPNRCYMSPITELPELLQELSNEGVKQFGIEDYNPEAVIVNFYDISDNMGGHLDDGEPDQIHPIISYSIGNSCVFLIGGQTKEIKPHAIKLDGGDILIMSREARLSYHGVPRVIENTFPREIFEKALEDAGIDWKNEKLDQEVLNDFGLRKNGYRHIMNYLEQSRININIRQVFLKGEEDDILLQKTVMPNQKIANQKIQEELKQKLDQDSLNENSDFLKAEKENFADKDGSSIKK